MTIEALTWIRTGNKLTVILPNGQPKTVTEGEAVYETVLEAIKSRNWDSIPDLLDPKTAIYNFSDGLFEVIDGTVHVEGKSVPDGLSKKIIGFSKEGLPYKPLLNFWNKLQKNPSYRNIQGLFDFLDKNEYPITEDGDIIAYKGVNEDWTDCHTGTIHNYVGKTISMPRNEVNDNPNESCSRGFHCANFGYAWSYGSRGHMIMISVNPEHVVSMPNAYDFTKMRICEYTILSEVKNEEKGNLYKPTVDSSENKSYDSDNGSEDDSDEYCNYCDELLKYCEC
jgi:hypothetical protein